jgi:hypothetical protein
MLVTMRWWRRRQRGYEPGVRAYGAWHLYADTVEGSSTVVDRKDSGQIYEVSWVKSEAVALEYLRRRDVRQEGYYVIVETPRRNLGRDMVMIFDEADGSLIEIPERARHCRSWSRRRPTAPAAATRSCPARTSSSRATIRTAATPGTPRTSGRAPTR